MSGAENIKLNRLLLGPSRRQVAQAFTSIVEFSELGAYVDQPIRMYSSGMMKRLGISIVAHMDPEILIIDEVLAVSDLAFRKKCIGRMELFRKAGITMVLVSQAMDEVRGLCHRAMWIENHTIRMIGPALEVVEAYVASEA